MRTKLSVVLGATATIAAIVAVALGVRALPPRSSQPTPGTLTGKITPTLTPPPTTVPGDSEQVRYVPAPDGRWIAVVDEATGGLDLQDTRGNILSIFPAGSTVDTVAWSLDSHYLLAVRTNLLPAQPGEWIPVGGPAEIWQIRVEDHRFRSPALLFQAEEEPDIGEPSQIALGRWSPDSRYVLFWLGPLGASIEADGLPLRALDVETGQVTLLADVALLNPRYQSWAPDGSALVFTAGGYRSAQVNKWLTLFDVASGQVTTVVSKSEQIPGIVAWSPRGDLIAYAAVPSSETDDSLADWMVLENPAIAGRRVYLLDPTTGRNRRLNAADTFQDAPMWSEDGAILYYVEQERDTIVLMAADPATGQGQVVEGSRQPAPEIVGYYGQSDWDAWLAHRSSPGTPPTPYPTPVTSLDNSIPFTVCRSSETWTRPSESEQAAQVWDTPRRQSIPREKLWWSFQQSFYHYWGGNSEMFDAWPELGFWTAVSDSDVSGLCDADNWSIGTGQEIELWILLHRVVAAQRQGDEYTVIVEPVPAGYQVIHLPGPRPGRPIERGTVVPRDAIAPIAVRFVDAEGREIDYLPKLAPWTAVPTTDEVVTATGTVVDNALSAQVVMLKDADGVTWYIPWLEGTIVRRADGSPAQFQDITSGIALEVTGFRSADAQTPNTLAAVRAVIPVTASQVGRSTLESVRKQPT